MEQTFSLEMKGHPPSAESIREILLDAQDSAAQEDANNTQTKTELFRYLTKGRYVNHLNERLAASVKRKDTDEEAGTTHFSGVFAANDGRVFKFRRLNKQVMDITGVAGSGWLIIEGE